MNVEEVRDYCLTKKGVTEDTPFGPETLVFRVAGKIFALMSIDHQPLRLNLKCDPERAEELRDQYDTIEPGYHMNKRHWNSIYPDVGELSDNLVTELIDHSYSLIFDSLPASKRKALQ